MHTSKVCAYIQQSKKVTSKINTVKNVDKIIEFEIFWNATFIYQESKDVIA